MTSTVRTRRSRVAAILAVAGIALASVVALPTAAQAATITVNDSGDGAGVGTIRYAAANAASGDTIDVTVPLSPLSTVTFPLGVIIEGNGNTVTRGAAANYPIFTFTTAVVGQDIVINNLNINGGLGTGSGISLTGGTNFRTITLDNVHMEGHTATRGAAVDIGGLSLRISVYDSEFINNQATAGPGGAIYGTMSQAGAEFYDTEFRGNTASSYGGAVAFEDHVALTPYLFEDLTVTDNTADGDAGGGIYVEATSPVTVTRGQYLRNTAQAAGGALYVSNAFTIDITGPITFSDNDSDNNRGGAAYLAGTGFGIDIDGATFTDNGAEFSGGALAIVEVLNNDSTLTNSTFESNRAEQGGALYLDDARVLTSTSVDFDDNQATSGNGGALYIASLSGRIEFDFARFTGNSAIGTAAGDGNGGAIAIALLNGSFDLIDAVVTGNTASGAAGSGFGGGLYVAEATGAGSIDIGRAEISNNTLVAGVNGNGAGAAFMEMADSYVRMFDNTFAQNIAPAGTAEIFFDVLDADFASDLNSLTIVGSVGIEANDNAGDIEVVDSALSVTGTSVVVGAGNPIAFSHSALTGPATAAIDDNGTSFFSVTSFNLGPLQNNGGFSRTMLPQAGSILIDNGHVGGGESWDQRGPGFPRILNGRIDIGAVETAAVLPATGDEFNIWLPIVGGTLLLGGIAAVVVSAIRRRRVG